MTVGGREFTFKKPVMRHVLYLRGKKYEEWLSSGDMGESTETEEKFKAFSEKWKEFCIDIFDFPKDSPFPSELEYENLMPVEIGQVCRDFFASLAGTLTEAAPPPSPSPASNTTTKSK